MTKYNEITSAPGAIPFLPGYKVSLPASLQGISFNKKQTLHYQKGYQLEEPNKFADEATPARSTIKPSTETIKSSTGPLDSTTDSGATQSIGWQTTSTPCKLPQWVENDRKVLRWFGYFREYVTESRDEQYRTRRLVLYYYLEDNTMHVDEPRQDNSGLPQGLHLKRHSLVKEDGAKLGPGDFKLGDVLRLYGRSVLLVDADAFTREYYQTKLGITLPPAQPYPVDPIETRREEQKRKTKRPPNIRTDAMAAHTEAQLGKASHVLGQGDTLKQFLSNNRQVLRFWAFWDEREHMYGDRRPYKVHYFLEDDSVEILDLHESNSGRDPFPLFLRRGLLPKSSDYGLTNRLTKSKSINAADLYIGATLHVHNRKFVIFDCDEFTRAWYKANLGYDDAQLTPLEITEPTPPTAKPALAPYNGYGTLEDSLQNCVSLIPKPPKKDLRKLINKDRMVLRFVCKFSEQGGKEVDPTDKDRKFVLSYFMADDTISIFEPPVRNTGFIGGKYLERQRIYKAGTEETFNFKDLYAGARLLINGRLLELLEADEYTYTYMENNKHLFIMADSEAIIKMLKSQVKGRTDDVRTNFIAIDTDGSGLLSWKELGQALSRAGLRVTNHQVIALCRHLDKDKSGEVSVEEFLSAMGIALDA